MKKRLPLLLTVLVSLLLIGATSWAADTLMTAPSPAPTTTLTPIPLKPAVITQPTTISGGSGSAYYNLAPAQKLYFGTLTGSLIYPGQATGVLTGTFANPNVSSGSYDFFHGFGYKEEVCVPKPLVGGCLYKHTYGANIDWDFNVNGTVTYSYSVPYKVDFSMPVDVFPGQRIYLAPTFTWDQPPPSVTSDMNYNYSHVTSFWADAPFDGMDDLRLGFEQLANSANISVGIPVLPLISSISGKWNVSVPPFSSGGGEYGGSYTKLGGAGRFVNSGKTLFNAGPKTACVLANGATSGPAWKTGHEQFLLSQTVLGMIPSPPTTAAATALGTARQIGGFMLNTQLDGSINRQDYVCLELSDLSYVDVPSTPSSGTWSFTGQPVTLKYRVYGVSTFGYYLGYGVTFDMNGMNPMDILHGDFLYVPAGGVVSAWQEKSGEFKITGNIPIRPRLSYNAALLYDASRTLGITVQAPSQLKLTRHDPATAKIATLQQTRNVIQTTKSVPFPMPTAQRGTPQGGEYTVVLGAAVQARADEIVTLLKRMGINAYVVKRGSTTEPVVTLGAFLSQAQAQLLAGMLKEICKVDSVVVQSLSKVNFRVLNDDDVRKLNIPW